MVVEEGCVATTERCRVHATVDSGERWMRRRTLASANGAISGQTKKKEGEQQRIADNRRQYAHRGGSVARLEIDRNRVSGIDGGRTAADRNGIGDRQSTRE